MKTVIVYAHPWDGSFNYKVLKHTINQLEAQGETVDLIDLYEDGFNPVMEVSDLRLFGKGEYADPLAEAYVQRIKEAQRVMFIFPVWWYGPPAILKGFFDKILLKNKTYIEDENRNLHGVLDIQDAAVLTTANISKEKFKDFGSPIENIYINGIFKMVGIENAQWLHCPSVHLEESRDNYLEEIDTYLGIKR